MSHSLRVVLSATDNPKLRNIGGKHIHLLLLERGLKELGFHVDAIYPIRNYSERKSLKKYLRYAVAFSKSFDWISPYRVYMKELGGSLLSIFEKNASTIAKADIVHFNDTPSLYYFLYWSKHRKTSESNSQPKLLTLHGYFPLEFIDNTYIPFFMRKRIIDELFNIERRAVKQAKYIIAVDNRIAEYLIKSLDYPAKQITVLHNAVDTLRFSPPSQDELKVLRKKLGIGGEFVVLIPRRLVPKNGVDYAVRAAERLYKIHGIKDIKILIAGGGIQEKELRFEIKKLGLTKNCILLGEVSHNIIHEFFKVADVVLIPSVTSIGIQEGSSLAALEGMSCAKPVVASDIGGLSEIIENNKTGLLVKERNVQQIADALALLWNDRKFASRLGKAAREKVLKDNSYLAHARQIAKIYEQVTDSP
jgi:glycosyltransferase involved in cell wall biosynthesis